MRALVAVLAVALLGCEAASTGSEAGPDAGGPATPAAGSGSAAGASAPTAAWDGRAQGAAWTRMLVSALDSRGGRLLAAAPADAASFCPDFAALDRDGRVAFWVGLVSKMAQFESGFDPATAFTESFVDSQGDLVVSRGLLQLSFESADAYRGCDPASPEALHDPATNLDCTVAILDRLVPRDGVIAARRGDGWGGGAAYWSVLRSTSPRRAAIEAFTRGLEICRAG